MTIQSIQPSLTTPDIKGIQYGANASQTPKSGELSFNQVLESLDNAQNDSDALLQKLATGEEVDLHQVMIASEQTDISFRIAIAIRDKLVDAYREVMRMSV